MAENVLVKAQKNRTPAPDLISEGLMSKFGQGGTLGFRDELTALLSTQLTNMFDPLSGKYFTPEENYENVVRWEREKEQNYANAHPVAGTVAEMAGALATGGATLGAVKKVGGTGFNTLLAAGAGEGAIYGAGSANENNRLKGAATGALVGSIAAPVAAGMGNMANRVFSKLKEVGERASQVSKGKDLGYTYTPAQRTGDKTLAIREAGMSRDPATVNILKSGADNNQLISNNLAAKSIGEDSFNLGAGTIDNAYTRLGKEFEDLAGLDKISIRDSDIKNVQKAIDTFGGMWGQKTPPSFMTDALEEFKKSKITGLSADRYSYLSSQLGKMLKKFKNDPAKLDAVGELRTILNEAVENSLPKTALPRWKKARKEWGNLQTLIKPGVISKTGDISEPTLYNKLRTQNAGKLLRGQSDELGLIGRLGSITKEGVATSGTAEALAAQRNMRQLLPDVPTKLKAKLYMKFPQLFTPNTAPGAGIAQTPGVLSVIQAMMEENGE